MLVRYYGHMQQRTGYGRAALDMARALQRAGVTLDVRTIGPPGPQPFSACDGTPDAVIVHTLPGDCTRVLRATGLGRGDRPRLVAYTTWEALSAPSEITEALFSEFDQVWVPSGANAAALCPRQRPCPQLHVIPHTFDERIIRDARPSKDSKLYRFLWVGAWTARKNPLGLIRAFALAFTAQDQVELVMHSPGCSLETFAHALASTGCDQADLPRMTLSAQSLDDEVMSVLYASADAFATASRGEAWNLPAFESLLAGKHVITQYGLGSDDYLLNTSADLVDGIESPAQVDVTVTSCEDGSVTMRRVGAQGLTSRCLWSEPMLPALADAMVTCVDNDVRSIAVNYDVAEKFGYAAVANLVLSTLEKS